MDRTSLIISQMVNLSSREPPPCLLPHHFLESESWNFTLNGRSVTLLEWWRKVRIWIHESGWWQLTQTFLWSHRSSPSPCAPHLLDLREHWTTFATAMRKPQHGWQWSFQMDVEMHLCLFWKWSPGCLWCVVVFPEASGSVFEWLDHLYLTSTWSRSLQTELSLRWIGSLIACGSTTTNGTHWAHAILDFGLQIFI